MSMSIPEVTYSEKFYTESYYDRTVHIVLKVQSISDILLSAQITDAQEPKI